MKDLHQIWMERIGRPTNYEFEHSMTLVKTYDRPEYEVELYLQANGVGTTQRLMMLIPKCRMGPVPCVAVPYYFPEGMMGYDPQTGQALDDYDDIAIMVDLVRRGYAVASADSFHLTYVTEGREREGFLPWTDSARALLVDHPDWTGIGKLVADTQLVIDALAADPRTNEGRIGIMGHSLGGVMSFYTGCLDSRIRAIVASDFGFGWDQTNWRDIWYWGAKVEQMKAEGIDHTLLLGSAAPKPMMLFAGCYDNEESWLAMRSAPGYEKHQDRLAFINHATGHRPPVEVLEQGYDFLDRWLK